MLPWEQSTFLAPPPQGRCGAWPQGGRRTKISHGSSARPVSIARERRKDAHWLNFSKTKHSLDLTTTKQTYYGAWGQKVTPPCGVPNECAPATVLGSSPERSGH